MFQPAWLEAQWQCKKRTRPISIRFLGHSVPQTTFLAWGRSFELSGFVFFISLQLSASRVSHLLLLLCSHSVMSYSLWLHGLQQPVFPCPSQSPKVCSDSCPLSQWCHPTPPYALSLPSLSSLNLSQHQDLFQWIDFPSGGQSTGASAFVLTMNIQGWFPIGLTSLILLSKGLSRVFSSTTFQNHQFFSAQPSLWSNSYIRTWPLEML